MQIKKRFVFFLLAIMRERVVKYSGNLSYSKEEQFFLAHFFSIRIIRSRNKLLKFFEREQEVIELQKDLSDMFVYKVVCESFHYFKGIVQKIDIIYSREY